MTTDATKATHATDATVTDEAVSSLDGTADPRLRELLTGLIRHLHAFARETRLTQEEWERAVGFLTATGQTCTDTRQEFILLSDVLGLSMLVETINGDRAPAPPSRRSSAPST